MRVFLREEIYRDCVDLVIFDDRDGRKYVAKPVEFQLHEPELIIQPTISFRRDDNVPAQLKKELQAMGLIDNADAATVSALKYHLEDMRSLVFRGKK